MTDEAPAVGGGADSGPAGLADAEHREAVVGAAVEQEEDRAETREYYEAAKDYVVRNEFPDADRRDMVGAALDAQDIREGREPEREESEQPDSPAPNVPDHFSDADKARLSRMAPEDRAFVLDKHRQMLAAHTRRSQEIAPMRHAIGKFAENIQASGYTPEQAVEGLLEAENVLRHGSQEQKVALLRDLVERYGVGAPGAGQHAPQAAPAHHAPQHAPGPQAAPPGPQAHAPDPEFDRQSIAIARILRNGSPQDRAAVLEQLNHQWGVGPQQVRQLQEQQFEQRSVELANQMRNATPEQRAAIMEHYNQQFGFDPKMAQAERAIHSFATAKDAGGAPLYPHFQEVQPVMERYARHDLEHGVSPDLHSLYERAIWANADIREGLIAERSQADLAQGAARRRQEAEKAKRAGGMLSGAGNTVSAPNDNRRATIAAALDAVS